MKENEKEIKLAKINLPISVVLAFFMIFLYMTPIYMIFFAAYKTSHFLEDHFLINWFAAFINSHESTLSEFHKVLFPVISGISVVAFTGKKIKSIYLLIFFILVMFALTIYTSVIFDIEKYQSNLNGLKGLSTPLNLETTKLFFIRVQETLLIYLSILVGIESSNKLTQKND